MDILQRKAQESLFRDSLGVDMPTSSIADELRERSRQNGIRSLYFFTTAVLGWNKLQVNPHREMCDYIQAIPPRRKVVLIPRDCYKSTVGPKSLPLWILIQPDFCGLPGLEHRILLASHSSVNSQKNVQSLQAQIERNDVLRWLYPHIIPDLSKTTWTKSNLLFPRQGMYGEDTIEAAGVDTHLVSRHYTVQIKDDLEDQQSYEQPSVRQQVKNWYKAAEALFVDERQAVDILIGTRWGIDDLYSEIQTNESDTYAFMTRPLHWTREELEYDLRIARESKRPPVYNMQPEKDAPEEGKTYYFFPELFPEESCQRIRKKQGSFMYSMLYLNNPRDPALAEFREKDVRYFEFDGEGNLLAETEDQQFELVQFDDLHRVLFWDPALTEKEKKKRSRNAMIVVGQDSKYRLFALGYHVEFNNPMMLLQKFLGLHQRFMVHKAAIEDAGFQRILQYPLYHLMDQLDYKFPVEPLRPIGDKDARIRSLIPAAEQHKLFIRRGMIDLLDELRGFPVFPTKDLLDATAACQSLLSARKGSQPSRSRPQLYAVDNEEARLASRNATTGY